MQTIDALTACLPPVAYDRAGAEVGRELSAAAAVLDDAIVSADTVVLEQQPDKSTLALEDWERNYALPDDGVVGTESERRSNLQARITSRGNLSRDHLVGLAEVVGFPGATITEYDVMTCEDPCDSAVNDERWIGAWRMDAPAGPGSQDQLQRLIERRKPAHTIAFINFA
jgi:uncharacterized protein YmfQ (DUF2313 family)